MKESMIVEAVKNLMDMIVEVNNSKDTICFHLKDETGEYCVRVLSHGIQLCKIIKDDYKEEMFLLKV